MPTFLVLLSACELLPFVTSEMAEERFDLDNDGVPRPDDCDDDDPNIGIVTQFADVDEDGYGYGVAVTQCATIDGYAQVDGDCDDQDAALHPDAAEICDGIDNDCDGGVDVDPTDGETYYADNDADGFGDITITVISCSMPDDYVTDTTDCDDENAAINPDAIELCDDEIDNDCDSEVDEDASYTTQYQDDDEDGYGDPETEIFDCDMLVGYVTDGTDCDDANAQVNPSQEEICNNGLDDDCDGGAGECVFNGTLNANSSSAIITGEASEDKAGISIAPVGDIDGDNKDDLMIGSYLNDRGGTNAGAAYIISGPIMNSQSLTDATTILSGTESSECAGCSVSSAGDLNDDGWSDIIIGASGNTIAGTYAGAAYLIHGPITGTNSLAEANTILTGSAASYVGISVASAGDMNADGFGDVLIGAYLDDSDVTDSGVAYLIFGPTESGTIPITNTDNLTLAGESSNDYAGLLVAPSGDMNGDGAPDILIGAFGYHNDAGAPVGALYIVYGPKNADQFSLADADGKIIGMEDGDEFGKTANNASDTNRDGYNEIIVGAPANDDADTDAGAAYLIVEIVEGESDIEDLDGLTKFTGRTSGSRAGNAVIGAGDLDVDEYDDIVVGAYLDDDGGSSNSGAVFIFFGPINIGTISLETADTTIVGESANDQFGFSLASTGDLNGDEYSDFAVGAYYSDRSNTDAGSVYIFSWLEI